MKNASLYCNVIIGSLSIAVGLYLFLSAEPGDKKTLSEPKPEPKTDALIELASVDLSRVSSGYFKDQSDRLGQAMSQVGFAYLINVPGFEPDELLNASQWFFALPNDLKYACAKNAFKPGNPNHYRGYFPLVPGGTSYKEAFEVGAFFDRTQTRIRQEQRGGKLYMRDIVTEGNTWPGFMDSDIQSDQYREVIERYYKVYAAAAETTLQLLAHHWGLGRDYFVSSFGKEQLSTFRLLHYPDRRKDADIPPEALLADGQRVTTAAHFDTGILTLLATFHYDGLQLDLNHDGNWQSVRTNKHGLVVNTGRMLSLLSGGRIQATSHRVIDVGASRFSAPFFYEPHFDMDISRDIDGQPIGGIEPGARYGPWMVNLTSQYAEYRTTEWGIVD